MFHTKEKGKLCKFIMSKGSLKGSQYEELVHASRVFAVTPGILMPKAGIGNMCR